MAGISISGVKSFLKVHSTRQNVSFYIKKISYFIYTSFFHDNPTMAIDIHFTESLRTPVPEPH